MIILILLNSIVALSSYLTLKNYFNFEDNFDSILAFSLLFLSQVVLTLTALGALGLLYIKNIVLLSIAILLASIVLSKTRPINMQLLRKTVCNFKEIKIGKLGLFCFSIILGFVTIKVIVNFLNPPFGWDDLNYHFTFPVEWLKHGNLDNPIVINDDPAPSYYPINGSLIFFWLMAPLKNFFIADVGQLPFFILAFLVVYNLARRINFSKELAFFSATLFVIIPNFFKQLQIAYVDLMVATLFLIALNFCFILKNKFNWPNLILCATSLGLLLGTKSLAFIYALLLVFPIIFLFSDNLRKFGPSRILVRFFVFIFVLILLGGFSYIRNFISTGNPFFPLDVVVLGKTIFKGAISKVDYSAHFIATDYALSKFLFHEGLGLQTLLFVLPGALFALFFYLSKNKQKEPLMSYFLMLPLILYFVFRYIIPLANVRYVYNLLAIGIICGFYVCQKMKVPLKTIKVLVAICCLASMAEMARHRELLYSLLLSALYFIFLISSARARGKICMFVVVLILPALIFLENDYVRHEFKRYMANSPFWPDATKAWAWLNNNTNGDNISYVGRPVPLPLYGEGLKNNVFYTSLNNVDPVKFHYFKNARLKWDYGHEQTHKNLSEPYNYRGKASRKVWLNNLERRKADYLFIYSLHQTKMIEFPIEDSWASTDSIHFTRVFTNDSVHIYRINL